MKLKIYGILAISLMAIFFVLILSYYTQDFNEEFEFQDIEYYEIYVEKDESILYSVEAKIGKIILENNGYFTQLYTTPKLIGCLDLVEGEPLKFTLFLEKEGDKEIKVGETKTFNIYSMYNGRESTSKFAKENLKELKIYKMPKKSFNPLQTEKTYYNPDRYSCDNAESDYELIGTLEVL